MAAFLAALPAFIQALPYFLQLAVKIMALVERLIAWADKNNLNGWLENVETHIDALEKANTPEEKSAAARGLGSVLRGL
jgi:predicted nucleic acid-binding protein